MSMSRTTRGRPDRHDAVAVPRVRGAHDALPAHRPRLLGAPVRAEQLPAAAARRRRVLQVRTTRRTGENVASYR